MDLQAKGSLVDMNERQLGCAAKGF